MDAFALWGVRIAAIVWNNENPFAFPAISGSEKGLTQQGRALITRMNKQHMAVDVSHLNIAGVKDALTLSKAPIIATHSCCRALRDHPRNLSDEQLKAIFNMGGYVGVNFFPMFLHQSQVADIDTVINHIDHMASMGGAKHMGMGSDFDGIETHPVGLEHAGCVYALFERMQARGYSNETIADFAGENLKTVYGKNLDFVGFNSRLKPSALFLHRKGSSLFFPKIRPFRRQSRVRGVSEGIKGLSAWPFATFGVSSSSTVERQSVLPVRDESQIAK